MCRLCSNDEVTRRVNLYVFGSEDLDVCHKCEMALVNFARKLAHEHAMIRIAQALEAKEKNKELK